MRNSYLQPVADKLQKRSNKIIYIDELKAVIKTIMADQYTDQRAYKLIYHLKNKEYLISLKKNIFVATKPTIVISMDALIEDYYRMILHQHCNESVGKNRYIWWVKAMEFQLKNLDIPDEILIVTEMKQGNEIIVWDKSASFKKYTSKKVSLFPTFKKHLETIKFGKYSFKYACKEIAILETLYNFDKKVNRYEYEIVKKIIKKNKQRAVEIFENIIKIGKHHTSINRLYDIAKQENKALAEKLITIIKKYSFILDI